MTDTLNAPLANSPNSTIAAVSPYQAIPSLELFGTERSGSALFDPIGTAIQANIPQLLSYTGAGVSGIKFSDLTENLAVAPIANSWENGNSFDRQVDLLLGLAGNSSLLQNCGWFHPPDTVAPQVTIGLTNDTGSSNTDKLTNNPSVRGTVTDDSRIKSFRAQLDGGKSFNISNDLHRGKFSLDRADIQRLNSGKKLTEGKHSITISATDRFNNKSTTNFDFTFDSIAPIKPGFALDSDSDTGIISDNKTTLDKVILNGLTEANATVTIRNGNTTQTTQANATGQFNFSNVALRLGDNKFNLTATNAAGNKSTFNQVISRTEIDPGDVVTDWNSVTLKVIKTSKTAPPIAAYNLALVQGAVFDAVNTIEHKYATYHTSGITAPLNASVEAAAAAAAYQVLVKLYPTQTSIFDAQLVKSLARVADGQSETDGVKLGKDVANEILAWRSNDGAAVAIAGTNNTYKPDPNKTPGAWQPTPDGFKPAVLPEWGNVTPFIIGNANTYIPPAPPAIGSEQYAIELNQVKALGGKDSTTRTADQTEIATFWAYDRPGTYTPPGQYNEIAQLAAGNRHSSIIENARLFATLNIAMADASICCWETKYTFDRWRPVTAIREADTDGNDKTKADANWSSFLNTPAFPAYTSGHSTFSGVADSVLTGFFGDNYAFTATSFELPGVTRKFTSFRQAAEEDGISRIYGGVHFMSDNIQGLKAGRDVGNFALTKFAKLA